MPPTPRTPPSDTLVMPETFPVMMTPDEAALIRQAIDAALREIDREEFSTRVGVDVDQAETLRTVFGDLSGDFPSAGAPVGPPIAPNGSEEIVFGLTADQLLLVNNALNESLHGLPAASVPATTGDDRARAEALLASVGALLDRFPSTADTPNRGDQASD